MCGTGACAPFWSGREQPIQTRGKPMRSVLLAAALALVLSAGAAAAASAVVESPLNLRAGPGTQYPVVGSIPGGAPVDVAGCTGSWCQVQFGGESGFASSSYLRMA